ncbi:MAG: iron ABC transporter substrate-binding protein [Acidimicrobiales bacterium]|nr:iron ABC transporter substrate-binding protein [Acidimicrobiales bacterium]
MSRFLKLIALLTVVALLGAACGDDDDGGDDGSDDAAGTTTSTAPTDEGGDDDGDDEASGTLVVYSGRSEELVGPVLEMFTDETGIDVDVRYGDTAEMAGLIITEGGNSPADLYYGQDAGALGALASEGRLAELPDDVLAQVPESLRSTQGQWIGLSGRARVVVYNTEMLDESDLPDSILDFTDEEWAGRVGWAPTNGSFQAFVTALRVLEGEDGARDWLSGMVANDAQEYTNNTATVEAVAAGEVEVGFVNHYYLYRFLAEDADYPAANKFYSGGDPGALINVAGAGIVDTSDQQDLALELIEFLLSEQAQEYFAQETYEIPVVDGVEPAAELPDLDSLTLPDIDLDRLEDLEGTLELLTEVGAL